MWLNTILNTGKIDCRGENKKRISQMGVTFYTDIDLHRGVFVQMLETFPCRLLASITSDSPAYGLFDS